METNQPSIKNQEDKIAKNTQERVSGIQTMSDDYVHAVQDNTKSLADVALEAQKKRQYAQYNSDPNKIVVQKKTHTGLYSFFIVLFLIASMALIGYKFVFGPASTPDPFAQFAVKSPMLPNEQIGISSDEFKNGFEDVIINLATQTPVKENAIVQIYFTDGEVLRAKDVDEDNPVEITDIATIFSLLSPNIPQTLARSLQQNNYVYGLYGIPNNKRSQFLLLKAKNYQNSFAGMIAWEKTITEDLSDILQIEAPENLQFADRLYFNKDVRSIETLRGETILLYSFIDTNTILITKDPDIFRDLLTRYYQSPQ